MLKKFIAEFIGTFVLVAFAVGTAIATGGDVVATALAFGLVIVAMAYSIGRISGCHINPAVSIAMLMRKKMTLSEFGVYVLAQILGGICGAVVFFAVYKLGFGDIAKTAGSNLIIGYAGKMTAKKIVASLLIETILTFIFVYTILNATDEKAGNAKIAGLIIGLTLTLVHLVAIRLTGTSVNPARSIATAVGNLIFKHDTTALKQIWIFIVAPLAGGALAALTFGLLHDEASAE